MVYFECFNCSILREGHPEQVVVPVRAAAEPGHAQPAAARPRHAGGGEGGSGATVLPQRHEVPPPQLRPRRQEGQQRRAGHLPHQPGQSGERFNLALSSYYWFRRLSGRG